MNSGKPFLIDINEAEIKNHIGENDKDFPFEFSATNYWNQSFFTPEIPNNDAFDLLKTEIENIKQLVIDIKELLTQMFELQKPTDFD